MWLSCVFQSWEIKSSSAYSQSIVSSSSINDKASVSTCRRRCVISVWERGMVSGNLRRTLPHGMSCPTLFVSRGKSFRFASHRKDVVDAERGMDFMLDGCSSTRNKSCVYARCWLIAESGSIRCPRMKRNLVQWWKTGWVKVWERTTGVIWIARTSLSILRLISYLPKYDSR